MKNFARLVRFAWPYRVRFGLSLACAVMVAIFWGGNIGLVYPLLQVLIRSENCQHWVEEKIDATHAESLVLRARLDELDVLTRLDVRDEVKRDRLASAGRDAELAEVALRAFKKQLVDLKDQAAGDLGRKNNLLSPQERDAQIAEARLEEVRFALPLVQSGRVTELAYREGRWGRDLAKADLWNWRFRKAEPYIKRFLPDNGFKTLLLVIALVMIGTMGKGFFLFLQDVLVSDLTQLTIFDIRNQFFRRTMALDLSNFNDQGSAELLARFTNDMDSVQQGLVMTIMGRVDPRAASGSPAAWAGRSGSTGG